MPKPNPPASRLHRHLRLQHHAHTGKLLHHRHTSYRGLVLLLAVAGVCMFGLNQMARATADTITVYAAIYAAIPTDPPVITSPENDFVSQKSTLSVSGTCPSSTTQIVIQLLVDGSGIGSTPCDSSDNFSFTIVLTPGNHILVARPWTITSQAGIDSAPVHVLYSAPAPVTSNAAQALAAEEQSGSPLIMTEDTPFVVFGPEKNGVWSGSITGGTLPYRVRIGWGDGKHDTYTVRKSGAQQFSHHYTSMEPHIITFHVTDSAGRGIIRDYAAVTPYLRPTPIFASTAPTSPYRGSIVTGMYGVYLLAISGVGFAWIIAHRNASFSFARTPVRRPVKVAASHSRRRSQ
ncbi:MAG TPA: hypothetical protein VLF59_03690 [Candidatus Saccharimonadales bacterium]|nr:hypothetical protein [Candidatus Saccharimonadales bacterium]